MLGIDRSAAFQFDPCSESPHLGDSDPDSFQRHVVLTLTDHLGCVQEGGHERNVNRLLLLPDFPVNGEVAFEFVGVAVAMPSEILRQDVSVSCWWKRCRV